MPRGANVDDPIAVQTITVLERKNLALVAHVALLAARLRKYEARGPAEVEDELLASPEAKLAAEPVPLGTVIERAERKRAAGFAWVVDLLRDGSELTIAELSQRRGVTVSFTGVVLRAAMEAGLVERIGKPSRTAGGGARHRLKATP